MTIEELQDQIFDMQERIDFLECSNELLTEQRDDARIGAQVILNILLARLDPEIVSWIGKRLEGREWLTVPNFPDGSSHDDS